MMDLETFRANALSDQNKEFLDRIGPQVEKMVEEFAEQLFEIENRTGMTAGLERDFEINGRTVTFSIELQPKEGKQKAITDLLNMIILLPCDCPPGVCKEEEEQFELPLSEPEKKHIN